MLEFHITIDEDVVNIDRSAYNFFQVLGDVGGLYGILFSVAASLHSWLNYSKAENYMTKALYQNPNQTVTK